MPTEPSDQPVFKLKNIYSPQLLRDFALMVRDQWSMFPVDTFQRLVFNKDWEELELKERMRHISISLREVLPDPYREALEILLHTTLKMIADQGEKMVFEHGFLPDFVQQFGVDQPDLSIPALEQITRWTSAEFAVRPYLKQYPDRMYAQMLAWSTHESKMVRRLASEGFRPRLPWGMGILDLKKEPSPIIPVLENLKGDPAETVRRSVANNLNDISKDHPELALRLAEKWMGHTPETDWVVRHACRGLLKKGHPAALRLFGFNPTLSSIEVHSFRHDPTVKVGERLYFNFTLKNTSSKDALIRLEYAIDYQTLSGKVSHKVFKISEFSLAGGEQKSFKKNQRFQDFTTRKHFPGSHRLAILVNGQEMVTGTFEVLV